MLSNLLPTIQGYVDEHIWKAKSSTAASSHEPGRNSEAFWQEYESAADLASKLNILKASLCSILKSILKLEESDVIEDSAKFQEMGVDSLMFVEIKNAVQSLLGDKVTVNASALKDAETLEQLVESLAKTIEGDDKQDSHKATREDVNKLIKEDCLLPDFIKAKPDQKVTSVEGISRVLITGCTGTLGPYVLKELSKRENISEIICLIRPGKSLTPEERLRKILVERNLLYSIDMRKIKCVGGNVAMPQLDMDPIQWRKFSDGVDAVFHCAASVTHVEHYDHSSSVKKMRAVNVQGLKNVLEFASSGTKLKRVYCASSVVAVANSDKNGDFLEDWPEVDDFDGVTTMAYPVSKFVGDMLMKQAVLERGIPGKVFRFPIISGDSTTGRFVLKQNHVMLRYLFVLKYGIMPEEPMPIPVLPVDVCARMSVELFFNPSAPDDVYNVCNAAPYVDQEFVGIAQKLGYHVDTVEFSKFSEKIREVTTEDSPFAMFKEFYASDDMESTFGMYPLLSQWMSSGEEAKANFMVSKKMGKYLTEWSPPTTSPINYIYRDLLFAQDQGWLEKYCK